MTFLPSVDFVVVVRIDLFAAGSQGLIRRIIVAKTVDAENGWIDPWRAAADDIGHQAASPRRPVNAAYPASGKNDEPLKPIWFGHDHPAVRRNRWQATPLLDDDGAAERRKELCPFPRTPSKRKVLLIRCGSGGYPDLPVR